MTPLSAAFGTWDRDARGGSDAERAVLVALYEAADR